jgi:hypothetical protein
MLPDVTYVDVAGESGEFTAVACEAEFVSKHVVLPRGTFGVRRVRIRMEGAARWFAVRSVRLFAPAAPAAAAAAGGGAAGATAVTDADLGAYITAAAAAPRAAAALAAALPAPAMQLVNMARDVLTSYLPHALRKQNRVAYGLLQPADMAKLGERQPVSRELLAVPFLGKDAPSTCSEFAHPDVLIALTTLAYQIEGMRISDVTALVARLKGACARSGGGGWGGMR